jgi:hypothetical protein
MALPPAAPHRQLKHRRSIDVQVFARGGGAWEVEARLIDTKTRDWSLASGVRPAGTPVHEMLLRLVIDEQFVIREAGAETAWMPYPAQCDAYGDVYSRLVGLNLLRGFRRSLNERLGGVQGCTHITELALALPTAVIQAFAGEVLNVQEGGQAASEQQPFQIDRCHALRSDGPVVRTYYPRWYQSRRADDNAAPSGASETPGGRAA